MDLPIKILNFDCETLPLFTPFTISSICDAADVFFLLLLQTFEESAEYLNLGCFF